MDRSAVLVRDCRIHVQRIPCKPNILIATTVSYAKKLTGRTDALYRLWEFGLVKHAQSNLVAVH